MIDPCMTETEGLSIDATECIVGGSRILVHVFQLVSGSLIQFPFTRLNLVLHLHCGKQNTRMTCETDATYMRQLAERLADAKCARETAYLVGGSV